MKYPNIKKRVIIGFLIIVSCFTILSLTFFSNFNLIYSINQHIIKHPFAVSNSVKDISVNINAMHRSMKDVALSQNDEQLNKALLKVNDCEKKVLANFKIVSERYLGDINDVNIALKTFNDWKPIRQEVIDLVHLKKPEKAAEITIGKGASHVDLLLSKVSILINFALNKADEFNNNSKAITKSTYNNSIILLLVISLLLFLSIFWIFQSINNPIKKITARINALSEKDHVHENHNISKNILTILNNSVDDLETLKNKLSELVLFRTKELREEKDFTELAINNQFDTFFVFNPETGKAIRWNKSFCDVSGYTNEEITNAPAPLYYYNKEDLEKASKAIQEAYKKGIGIIRMNLISKNKKHIPFEYHISSMIDHNSGNTFMISIGRNITKQLKYEAELKKHRNLLQKLVDDQTREIQVTNEELQAANEEQATMNEELTVTNEELAITNEELEKATKKLANSNEKLLTANNELERYNSLFINREFRIKELKDKIKELENYTNS